MSNDSNESVNKIISEENKTDDFLTTHWTNCKLPSINR